MCCRVPWCRPVLQRIPSTAVSLTEFSVYSSARSRKFSNCRKQRNKKNCQKIPEILKMTKNPKIQTKNTKKKNKKNTHTKKKTHTPKKKSETPGKHGHFSESTEILFFFFLCVLVFFVFLVFFCIFVCVFFWGWYFRLLMCFNTYFYCFLIWL